MKNFLERMWAAFDRYQERRATYLLLNTLSARQLQDIGITKGKIEKLFASSK